MTVGTTAVNGSATMADPGASPGVDAADLARYERLGAEWWDPRGSMRKLHEINPVRLGYLRDRVERHRDGGADRGPFEDLRVLDVGCGGGLLCEPLARLGARVTGLDPGAGNIAAARLHAEGAGLSIDYRAATAEDLASAGETFDVVLAMEVVEHVVDRPAFVRTVGALVRPGGLMVASTFNRTAKSYLLGIVGAEYILRWLPRGTHRWTRFVTPAELAADLRGAGLKVVDETGMTFDPLRGTWNLGRDTDVNYFIAARKPDDGRP